MSNFVGTKCDMEGCHEIKKETNHWWTLIIREDLSLEVLQGIRDFKEIPGSWKEAAHACGTEHAGKFASRYFAHQSFAEFK